MSASVRRVIAEPRQSLFLSLCKAAIHEESFNSLHGRA